MPSPTADPAPLSGSDLFARLSPALASEIFNYLQTSAKPTYVLAVQTLAVQRRLRPVFIERKPRAERHAWLQAALARPAAAPIAANFLQGWLVGAQAPLLCDFLDSLGIAHDGKGNIDSLPPCPGPAPVRVATDALLAKYPAEIVAVYLHCFLAMDPAAWAPLAEILATDARLKLPVTAASAQPAA